MRYGQKKYKDAYYEYMIPIPRRFIENKLQYSPGTHKNTYGILRAVLEDFDHLEPSNHSNWPIVGHFGTGQFSTGQFGTRQFGTNIMKRTIWHQEKLRQFDNIISSIYPKK